MLSSTIKFSFAVQKLKERGKGRGGEGREEERRGEERRGGKRERTKRIRKKITNIPDKGH